MHICKNQIITNIQSIFVSILFILLSVPVFDMTGDIIKPILICVIGSIIICLFSLVCKFSAQIIGNGLLMLMVFWLVFAIIKETVLQIQAGWVFYWIYFFYFDKLLMLGVIWLSASAFFCIRRLVQKKKKDSGYSEFFKKSSIAFLIFYVFLLVFSFVLLRLQTGDFPFRLFQPFATIKEYIADFDTIPYEVFMMFFGNLFYFTPLGYIFCILLSNKTVSFKLIVNIFFPITAFTLIEISQYLFHNGYCEFDDMMLNSIGFWLGNLLYLLANKFAYFISKGKYKSFWG